MGARAVKNPVVGSHYSTMNTPMQVTESGPDPRPGIDTAEGGAFSKGGPVRDPLGWIPRVGGGGKAHGITTKHDASIGRKGKG